VLRSPRLALDITQPLAQQHLAQPVTRPHQIGAGILPAAAQIAQGFLGLTWRAYFGQQPRPQKLRELARISPVCLDALS
jgi:hypothetical protein